MVRLLSPIAKDIFIHATKCSDQLSRKKSVLYRLSPEEADKSQLAFSPTAQRLVSYSASNNIKQVPLVLVWDVRARPKPEKSPEALRVVCRLLRYQPEWQLPQGAFVSKACADEVKDLPDVPAIVPTGQPPADCR